MLQSLYANSVAVIYTCCFTTTAEELCDCKNITDITADVLSNHKNFCNHNGCSEDISVVNTIQIASP